MERVTGIEPALSAWEADVLPLNYTRAAGRPSPIPGASVTLTDAPGHRHTVVHEPPQVRVAHRATVSACCYPTLTSGPRSTPDACASSRTTRRWCSPRASTCAWTSCSACSTTTSTRYIDPAEDQPDLTRLVEVGQGRAVHPAPRRVRPRLDLRGRHAARRPRRAPRGQVLARPARPAHPLDGRLRRPRLQRPRDPRAVQRGDPADQALAGHEDRPALLLPPVQPGAEPLRLREVRLPLPGPARPDREPLVPELPPTQV